MKRDVIKLLEAATKPYRDGERDYTFSVLASNMTRLLSLLDDLTTTAGCDVPTMPDSTESRLHWECAHD